MIKSITVEIIILLDCNYLNHKEQDAHVREQSRICGTRNLFTSLIEF